MIKNKKTNNNIENSLNESLLSNYGDYKHCLVWIGEPDQERELTHKEAKKLLKNSSSWFLKNTFNFDSEGPTNFWEIICDTNYSLDQFPSKIRTKIRKTIKDCDIRKTSKEELIECDGYNVYLSSFQRYRDVASVPSDRENWENFIRTDNISEFFGVFEKESGKLIAWARNTIKGNRVNYNTMKADPEHLQKHYTYYGLIFIMNQYYLGERNFKYVTDGFRSVTEHSNMQPFLEHNFHFRKAYCNLKLFYKPWLGIVVKILYPFRKFIPILQVKNLLKFEEINRQYI